MATRTKPSEDNFESAMLGYIEKYGLTVLESLTQYGLEYGVEAPPEVLRERNLVLVRLLKTEDTIRKMVESRQ